MKGMKTIQIGEKFDCEFDFRETCFGIVARNKQVLLVKKDGQYSLIGGGIEVGENAQECLKREFMEVAGMKITKIEPLVCVDCFWLAAGKYSMESKANIFVVDVDFASQTQPTEAGHEVVFVKFLQAERILPLPYHKAAIKEYLKQYR